MALFALFVGAIVPALLLSRLARMKTGAAIAAAIAGLAALIAPTGVNATNIEFDMLSHGDVVTTQFPGVTFSLVGSPTTSGPVAYALKDGGIADTGAEIPASELFGAFGLGITPGNVTDSIYPPYHDIEIGFAKPVDFFAITVLDAEENFHIQGFLHGSGVRPWVRQITWGPASGISLDRLTAPSWAVSAVRCCSTGSC